MVSFKNIILLHALFHVATSSESADLTNATTMNWSQVPYKAYNGILVSENSHSIAVLKMNDSMEVIPTAYELLVETHTFDGQTEAKSCDVDPSTSDRNEWNYAEKVTFLKSDRVLVTWKEQLKEEELRMKSRLVMMDTCQLSEPILFRTDFQMVVPFKNHFDILFFDRKRCSGRHYCKMSFDQDGKPVDSAPIKLIKPYLKDYEFMTISHAYPINLDNSTEAMVLTVKRDQNEHIYTKAEMYSPITGWLEIEDVAHQRNTYTNSSGYASLCYFTENSKGIDCRWVDDAHVNGKVLSLKLEKDLITLPATYNTADGNILLVKSGDEGKKLFVDKAHMDGKCGRIMEIAIPQRPKKIKMSISNKNEYCFSLIFTEDKENLKRESPRTHTFITKCVQMPETIVEDPLDQCGKNYDG